ncbi:cell division protein FtsW [Glaciecola sp. 2405UD65-10]|uniref:cell division protein FtsW n=1 Tax=Glaciecola sp. 2405UD65-10 TaxID=3397244 RepID=UPI003B5A7203
MNSQLSLLELFAAKHDKPRSSYNFHLILVAVALMTIGFVIITSASMPIADRLHANPYYFASRHGVYILLALAVGLITLNLPMQFWRTSNPYLMLAALAMLVAVLFIGRTVNGSTRWIVIGPITIQAAEPAKLFFFLYLAGYLVRRYEQVNEGAKGFFKPLFVYGLFAGLLLMQPDLGTVIVMFTTTLALLFLAGAKLVQFFGLIFTGITSVVFLIVYSEYRRNRIIGFLDPWADPFGTGYQLTQSLMAYGRGSWLGQGLGNSLQKLEFLPEAHTDFIMAILAEELGYIGVLVVLLLMFYLIVKALRLGNTALSNERPFEGFTAYGIGIWFCLQTAVNIGASTGMLPTKGLTLPLVSYGGSSLIIMSIAVAILIRIDFELNVDGVQAIPRKPKASKSAPGEPNE